jgi:hypothetical protein
VEPAFEKFTGTEQWRKDNQLDELFESIDIEEFEKTRKIVGGGTP